jgi:hypothetical protein
MRRVMRCVMGTTLLGEPSCVNCLPVLGYSDQPFVRRARGTLNFGEIPILLRPGTAAVRTNGPSQKLYLRFLFGQGLSQ